MVPFLTDVRHKFLWRGFEREPRALMSAVMCIRGASDLVALFTDYGFIRSRYRPPNIFSFGYVADDYSYEENFVR